MATIKVRSVPAGYYGAALILLLLATGLVVGALLAQRAALDRLLHTREVLERLESALATMQAAETGQRGYLLTGDRRYLEPYDAASSRIDDLLAELRRLTADNPVHHAALPRLTALAADKQAELVRTITLAKAGERDAALAVVRSGEGKALMDAARRELDRMHVEEERLLRERTADANRARAIGFGSVGALGLFAAGLLLGIRRVTQRDRARILASEQRFRNLAANIDQLAWIAESDGYITWYNQRWYDYTGTTLEQTKGFGWRAVHHPEHVAQVTQRYREAIVAGKFWEDTFPLRAADGRYGWFLSRAHPIRDDTGRIVCWFGTHTNITRERETEERLRASEEAVRRLNRELERRVEERTVALEDANRDLQAFAHSVAHDLRAPLRNIQGYATALLEDEVERLSEDGSLYAKRMAESATRLDGLIQDLLAYSRLSRAEIVPERVDLAVAVQRALSDLADELAAREAVVEVPNALPIVLAHRATLTQVLVNLVSNAIKFVAPEVTPRVVIASQAAGGAVRLSVTDNGIGIAPEHQQRVFKVFERLHGQERYPGTGIGLAIVKKGVERMAGSVELESEAGRGSRFTIMLPAAPESTSGRDGA